MQIIALIQAMLALSLAVAVTASAFCPVRAVRHRLGWLDAPAALPAALLAVLLATVGLVLAGCAGASSGDWGKANSTVVQIEHDLTECKYEAAKASPDSYGTAMGSDINVRGTALRDQCMAVKGYQKR